MIKQRLDHLDIARGIAIIMVVWAHADHYMDQAFYLVYLKSINEVIYAFHMALMFIISGALLQGMLVKNDFFHIFSRITRTILVPFFSLSLVFMCIILLAPEGFLLKNTTLLKMIDGILLHQSADWAPSTVLWYLFVLYVGTAFTAFLNKYLKLSFIQILAVALIIKLCSPVVDNVDLLSAGKFARNYVFIVIGVVFADRVKDVCFESRDIFIVSGAIVAFVPFFMAMDIFKPFFQLMTGVLGSFVILKVSTMAAKFKAPLIGLFTYCGVNAILIFVFHMPFFNLIRPVIWKLGAQSSFFAFGFWVFLGCVLPLSLGLILRKIPIIYELLLGRKPLKTELIMNKTQ